LIGQGEAPLRYARAAVESAWDRARAWAVEGCEDLTLDWIGTAADTDVQRVRQIIGSDAVFADVPEQAIEDVIARIPSVTWRERSGGGTIANTIVALRSEFDRHGVLVCASIRSRWGGGMESLAADLRRRLVNVVFEGVVLAPRRAVTLYPPEGGAPALTLLSEADAEPMQVPLERPEGLPRCLILKQPRSGSFQETSIFVEAPECIVVLLADRFNATWLRQVQAFVHKRGVRGFAFGRRLEFDRLGGLGERAWCGFEIVATSAQEDVIVVDGASGQPTQLVPRPFHGQSWSLGCGDAYAGTFLAARLLGESIEEAHTSACRAAALVATVPGPRAPAPIDLNQVFGQAIDRSSEHLDEAELFDEVRTSAGLTIVSCGETGVEDVAAQAAQDLGLPVFTHCPAGFRRSDGSASRMFEMGARVRELGSSSFRFTTWTNVFLADAILLVDPADSEGSAATREAALCLGRPLLDLCASGSQQLQSVSMEWIRSHRPRVLLVAGNRSDRLKIPDSILMEQLTARLASIAVVLASTLENPPRRVDRPANRPVRIASVNLPPVHWILDRMLGSGLRVPGGRRLLVRSGCDETGLDVEVAYVRSPDARAALEEGLVDAAFLVSDQVLDQPHNLVELLDTGVGGCLVVSLARADRNSYSGVLVAQTQALLHVGQQYYPNLKPNLICGAAEAWLSRGWADIAVDTWATGRSAAEHGLSIVDVMGAATLKLYATKDGLARHGDLLYALVHSIRTTMARQEMIP